MGAPELLRRDVHPAEVLLPGGRLLLEARVFVTDRRLLVWKVKDGRVQQVVEMALVGEPPQASRQSLNGGHLELAVVSQDDHSSRAVLVNQGAGCGCHSPLKLLGSPVPWKVPA